MCDSRTPRFESFRSETVPTLQQLGAAVILPPEPWGGGKVETLVWSDEIEEALRQRRRSLNAVLPLELHDKLHNLNSTPGTLQFDILPAPWQHSTSAVIVILLGCTCCESPLHALFGQQHLWEIIFSFIPLNVSHMCHVICAACRDLTVLLHRCEWTGRLHAPRMRCAYARD